MDIRGRGESVGQCIYFDWNDRAVSVPTDHGEGTDRGVVEMEDGRGAGEPTQLRAMTE